MTVGSAQKPSGVLGPFRMPIDGVRTIKGRGTLVSGTIREGTVGAGDAVQVAAGGGAPPRSTTVTRVVIGGRAVDRRARSGEAVDLLLSGVAAEHVPAGAMLRAR
jgi:elongation factor Tu